jgi:CBS domain-containing protein
MKVADLMNPAPVSVPVDATFGAAFQLLRDSRATSLPAVDAAGIYRGIFDLKDVWDVLLPKAAQLHRKSIENLAFVSTSVEKMKEQLALAASRPVTDFLTAEDAPPLHPDSPLLQAILLFDQYGETIAVVDRGTKKLVGSIASWQILDALR